MVAHIQVPPDAQAAQGERLRQIFDLPSLDGLLIDFEVLPTEHGSVVRVHLERGISPEETMALLMGVPLPEDEATDE
ncbi:hypothetical protein G3H63_09180 [Microbacterium resistens]|uniref:hypothetical protein n=1 Tax=Microbacterium resistens TaxID=156977 RepID=UPI001C586F4A|nr:hypothetical protein [Microbacterium resistens]MBW1639242.1 hypothetical protein [Microbacterium resistens]